jgi:hypothetical protein
MYRHSWGPHGYYRGGWGGGFFFLPGLFLLGLLFFGVLKFLWPLLLLMFIAAPFFWMMRGMKHGGWERRWEGGDWKFKNEWGDKPKNDWQEKPKNDDEPRYARTADGKWVEII